MRKLIRVTQEDINYGSQKIFPMSQNCPFACAISRLVNCPDLCISASIIQFAMGETVKTPRKIGEWIKEFDHCANNNLPMTVKPISRYFDIPKEFLK